MQFDRGQFITDECPPSLQHIFHKAPSTPATMSKQRSTLSKRIVRLVAFDSVASTVLLVWTGLNTERCAVHPTELRLVKTSCLYVDLSVTFVDRYLSHTEVSSQSHWQTASSRRNQDRMFNVITESVFALWFYQSCSIGWLRGSVVERRSLAGELSLSCARPVADG